MDALELAGAISQGGAPPVLVVASDHLVSYEERVCDTLSAGGAAAFVVGASGGFARLGASARSGREVYDVWRLGTEPEARYRLEVLFDAYAASAKEALARLERATERPVAEYAAVCASQPHPQTLRALGRLGVTAEQLEGTSFVGEIGNLGAASVGIALALGLDARRARRAPGGARLRRRGGDRPGDRGHRPRAGRRHGRPDPGRGDRSVRRTTVGPAAARPNPTREA